MQNDSLGSAHGVDSDSEIDQQFCCIHAEPKNAYYATIVLF